MFADYVREFCDGYDCYGVYENYSGRYMSGRRTIGIVVRSGHSYMDMLVRLTRFLEERDFDDCWLEMEGVAIDSLGLDTVVYFPAIHDYAYEEEREG